MKHRQAPAPTLLRHILWVDCGAAGVAGAAMLSLAGWLSRWYALPVELLRFIGLANLAYSAYSFSLAIRIRRPPALIVLLVVANAAWAAICFAMAAKLAAVASPFGLAQLIGEGLFVGGLASVEWSQRAWLVSGD